MPTLVQTVGSASSNSYVNVATADARLAESLGYATWAALDADAKERALISATRELDTLPWGGYRVTTTQALAWPREYAINPDRPYDLDNGTLYFAEDVIPARVIEATCRLALAFATAGTDSLLALDGDAYLTSKTVGPLSKSWAQGGSRPTGLARISGVMDQVGPLLDTGKVGSSTIAMVRV